MRPSSQQVLPSYPIFSGYPFQQHTVGVHSMLLTLQKIAAVSTMAIVCSQPTNADIYFTQKVAGPVTNQVKVSPEGMTTSLTSHHMWRELDTNVSSHGDLIFLSSQRDNEKIDLYKRSDQYNLFTITNNQNATQLSTARKLSTTGKQITTGQLITTEQQVRKPLFSPDSQWIAFIETEEVEGKDEIHHLKIIPNNNNDSNIDLNITPTTVFSHRGLHHYSWTPKGELLISYSTKEAHSLVLYSTSGQALKNITTQSMLSGNAHIAEASMSPDGKYIAYIQAHGASRERALFLYDMKLSRTAQVSEAGTHVQDALSWSSDSTKVLYSALKNYRFYYDETQHQKVYKGGMQIFISHINGNRQQLSQDDSRNQNPIFSPDNSRIAFLYADHLDARTLSLKVMNTDGSQQKTLHNSVATHSTLAWR